MTLRVRGAQTVRALGEVGNKLFPLRKKKASGQALSKEEEALLDQLETEYHMLEGEFHVLMRPRHTETDVLVSGRDHLHGPDDEHV